MARHAPRRKVLSRKPLGQQIADELRQDILLGRVPPGTPVSQEGLCDRYGTSRPPARDALVQLAHEGLVVVESGHTVVAAMTRADVIDAFDLCALAHGRAGRRAVDNITDRDIAELTELHEAMVEHADDTAALEELNWEFHRHINHLSGSAKLMAMIRNTSLGIPTSYLSELPGWTDRAASEHASIIEALRNRDADEVERLLREHLAAAGRNLADYLEKQGRFSSTTSSAEESSAESIILSRRRIGVSR